MKWYGIVAILILIFGLAGIVYLGMNAGESNRPIVSTNDPVYQVPLPIEKIINYDCDKNYKEYLELFEFVDPTESINSKSPARMAIYELEEELMNNGCL